MASSPDSSQVNGLHVTNPVNTLDGEPKLNGADSSPHAIGQQELVAGQKSEHKALDDKVQDAGDDELINGIIGGTLGEPGASFGLNLEEWNQTEIDQADKADDAVDFEDISDDDLASDDANGVGDISQVPELTEDGGTSHEVDDLFGDGEQVLPAPSSPPLDGTQPGLTLPAAPGATNLLDADATINEDRWNQMSLKEKVDLNFPTHSGINEWISEQSHQKTEDELLEEAFPTFGPHKVLFFRELFPEWPATYALKEPPKSPPELLPTKLELELEADTSKLFRISDSVINATQKRTQQVYGDKADRHMGVVALDAEDAVSDSDEENELVGGYSLEEIATICEDWDSINQPGLSEQHQQQQNGLITLSDGEEDVEMDDWDREFLQPRPSQPKKKRRYDPGLPKLPSYDTWGIDNFAEAIQRSARRVQLDMNDPYLLVEDLQSERPNKRQRVEEKTRRMANGRLGRDVLHRFNISNDEAYNALKANNKSKVRATLSNLAVEHSLPALRLTFPFYRTKIEGPFWQHHRKKFEVDRVVKHAIHFKRPTKVKKRDVKGRGVQELFKTSKDLSLNDNSTVVLFEYCEQSPIMMSNFGMGSRVINYYRRKDMHDEEKPPKGDLGEPHVLLPEDRSPFSIFGTVDPGETVPTLHNEMFRAPIFKHESRRNDFLLGHTISVNEGRRFYLKAIDHLYVVGQTFPSLEVPGPHARKVTNTTKNRLKMIAYRMMRKHPTQDVSIKEITPHVFDKEDPQNRQKMKEFLKYDRDNKTWILPDGETLMDEPAVRAMIKPEDVCLIEAMQVGLSQLQNAGYDPKGASYDSDDEQENDQPLVVKLAPWEITKNFIDACAGKAMVALHGEGDPTGHGLGFSFIKTSMKGGYINAVQGPLATSADAIERERKANGGHSYNVKKQQDMYNAAIQDIWGRQKSTLTDATTHEDSDVLDTANEDDRFDTHKVDATPAAHIDDGRSQLSRLSVNSRAGRRKLRILRKKRNEAGEIFTESVVVEDPAVIRNYVKHRKEIEEATRNVYELQVTGNADADRESSKLLEAELARLQRNQERRRTREKQNKGKKRKDTQQLDAGSPDASADKGTGGTTRKCANCGQVGHIKTNKSKCPLLNGTMAPTNSGQDNGGFGAFTMGAD